MTRIDTGNDIRGSALFRRRSVIGGCSRGLRSCAGAVWGFGILWRLSSGGTEISTRLSHPAIPSYKHPRPTPAPVPALGAPGGLTAVAGTRAGTVNLTWTPGANATIHWIYGVRLGPNNRVVWAGTGASGSYTVTGLPRGANYAFTVIAGRTVAGRNEWSSWTGWQSVTIPPATARLSPR